MPLLLAALLSFRCCVTGATAQEPGPVLPPEPKRALVQQPTAALAQQPASTFDGANRLYEEGKFAEAAAAYEKLAQTGPVSAALHFNLGNAYFKSSQIGRAIVAYRQVERLTPRDPDVRANLQFARNNVQGPTLIPGRSERWLGRLTLNEWTLLAASAMWLCFLGLTGLQYRPALKPTLRGYLVVLAIIAVILCAGLGAAWSNVRSSHLAVVTRELIVHNGPFDGSPTAFTAHDGAELRILDYKDDWLQVSADPRRIGWVRRDQVVLSGG